jgi:hypothetical protein
MIFVIIIKGIFSNHQQGNEIYSQNFNLKTKQEIHRLTAKKCPVNGERIGVLEAWD